MAFREHWQIGGYCCQISSYNCIPSSYYRNKSFSFLLTKLEMEGLSSASYIQPLTMATGIPSDLPITSSAADAISSAVAISVTFNFFPYISMVPKIGRAHV